MSDFIEKADEAGFSDTQEYLDYLCDEAAKSTVDDEDYYDEDKLSRKELINSTNVPLMLKNAIRLAKENGFIVLGSNLKLFHAQTKEPEVVRNISSIELQAGDILEIMYTPKNEIDMINKLLNDKKALSEIKDDVCFIKKYKNYNLDIWVGSPENNTEEEQKIIKLIKDGQDPKILVTFLIDKKSYAYTIVVDDEDFELPY